MSGLAWCYLVGSVAVGVGLMWEALVALRRPDERSPLLLAISFLALAWAPVSYLVWGERDPSLANWLMASYMAYAAANVAGAAMLFWQHRSAFADLPQPRDWSVAELVFGAYFTLAALMGLLGG